MSQDLITQNFPTWARIPPHRLKLLWRSVDLPRSHGFGLNVTLSISATGEPKLRPDEVDDPSTIYALLPVRRQGADEEDTGLPYFPSYSGMRPAQRGNYLQWLCDTSFQIEIGYVFVYYYGLERHLVFGDFDGAVGEILALRAHHHNSSFLHYSASALVHSCLLRQRMDKLDELYKSEDFQYFGNSNLLLLYKDKTDLTVDILIKLAWQIPGVNRKHLKDKPDLFRSTLENVLIERYGVPKLPFFNRFNLDDLPRIKYPIFANISLPDDVRAPALPNFLRDEKFTREISSVLRQVNDAIKVKRRRGQPA